MQEDFRNPFAILNIPHSSMVIPPHVRRFFVLSGEEMEAELIRMTDHFTDVLFDWEGTLARRIVFPVSRLVVDPERFRDDEDEPMSRKGMGAVYTKTSSGRDLRRPLSDEEKNALIEDYYDTHYQNLTEAVGAALSSYGNCLIIDCHSFPSKPLPYEDSSLDRPEICVGTDDFHTPDWLRNLAVTLFEEAGFRVTLNRPFQGSLVPPPYYREDDDVWSVMIEVNRLLYLNEALGEKSSSFGPFQRKLSSILRRLIRRALDEAQAKPR